MVGEEELKTDLARERTVLASERTVSAWIRTSLASIGGGFALMRFFVFQNSDHRFIANMMGVLLMICGMFILIFSYRDYRESCKKLNGCSKTKMRWIGVVISVFVLLSLFLIYVQIA